MKICILPIFVCLCLFLHSCGSKSGSSDTSSDPANSTSTSSPLSSDDNVAITIKNSQNPYYVITNRAQATVTVCAMDSNGNLGNCTNTQKPSGGSTADAVGFSNSYAYITRHGSVNGSQGAITVCSYKSSSGIFYTCFDSGASNLVGPEGIKIFNNSVYVIDSNANSLKICPNASSGSLSTCYDSGISSGLFSYPTNITFKGLKSYIVNFLGNNILLCDYNTSTGGLANCNIMPFNFNWPHSISFNGNFAYVSTTSSNIIAMCPLQADGTLGTCSNSGATNLNAPRGNVQFVNGFAYVASTNSNLIFKCPINSDGTLGQCVDSGATGITTPFSVDKMQ
ncbi:MAG: hypothetical protein K2X69_08140 [Silvanigrellaceae bacterium]|nr:hypothetical protein [Silvanigrellaceae bacterium]